MYVRVWQRRKSRQLHNWTKRIRCRWKSKVSSRLYPEGCWHANWTWEYTSIRTTWMEGARQADCSSRAWYILSAQKVVWKVAICICRQGWKTFSSVFVVFLPSWPGSPKMTATGPLLVVIVLRIRTTMWNKANFYIDTESTSWFLERILSKTILGLSIRWKLLMILMKY